MTAQLLVCNTPILIFLFFLSLVDRNYSLPSTLRLLPLSKYPNGRCLDGSPGGYYFSKSPTNSTSLYIHHQGGGWCQLGDETWPNDRCIDRANTSLGSTLNASATFDWGVPPNEVGCAGCSDDPAVNPLMHDWNKVYVLYCDGTTYASSNEEPFDGLFFNGKDILEGIADELVNGDFALGGGVREEVAFEEVVIGGSSAGGLAVYLHLDWWAAQFAPSTLVVGLPDGGFFRDFPFNNTADTSYDTDLRTVFDSRNLASGVNEKCVEGRVSEGARPSDCYFANASLPFIETPIFVVQTVYDSWQLQWENGMSKPVDYPDLNEYGSGLESDMIEAINSNRNNVVAGFIDRCYHHCTTDDLWAKTPTILGKTANIAFSEFFHDINKTVVYWQADYTLPLGDEAGCPVGMNGP